VADSDDTSTGTAAPTDGAQPNQADEQNAVPEAGPSPAIEPPADSGETRPRPPAPGPRARPRDDAYGLILTDDGLDDEEYRPRARRRSRRPARRGLWDPDTSERMFEGTSSVGRAIAVGYLSQLQLMADVASNFAGSVIDGSLSDGRRERPRRRASGERPAGSRRPGARRAPDPRPRAPYDGRDMVDDEEEYERVPRRRGTRRDVYDDGRGRYGPSEGRVRVGEDAADLADDLVDGLLDAFEDVVRIPRRMSAEMADSYERDAERFDRDRRYDRVPASERDPIDDGYAEEDDYLDDGDVEGEPAYEPVSRARRGRR
jgi:hypothetical protein